MSTPTIPGPSPDAENAPRWARDPSAVGEVENWDDEKALRGQERKNRLWWLKAYGIVAVIFTVVLSILFIFSIIAWSWHYLMPESHAWLTEAQLSKIQSVVFSGALGAIVSGILQKQLAR